MYTKKNILYILLLTISILLIVIVGYYLYIFINKTKDEVLIEKKEAIIELTEDDKRKEIIKKLLPDVKKTELSIEDVQKIKLLQDNNLETDEKVEKNNPQISAEEKERMEKLLKSLGG